MKEVKEPRRISPFDDGAILQIMAEAVAEAIETHRRLRQPIVGMSDGQIVWIAPEDIPPRPLPGDDEPLPTVDNAASEPAQTQSEPVSSSWDRQAM